MIDFGFYYNPYKTMTYNALFNFIIGNRGGGKTFGCKYYAVDNFIKTGKQFIYLRRYVTEMKTVKTFFLDIQDFFPDDELIVKGKTFLINGEIAGHAMALSTSKIEKSSSFPDVNKIIFDEFIIDKGVYHYLPNEIEYFLEFYETIARTRELRVFFLANAITQTNPYFIYFNIELPYNKMIQTFFNDGKGKFSKRKTKQDPDILIELVNNPDYIDMKAKTRFGQLIGGTKYYDYAITNEFLRDSKDFIEKKGEKAQHKFTIIYKQHEIGVWADYTEGMYYLSKDRDPFNELVYAFTTSEHKLNTMLIMSVKQSPILRLFFENFKIGNVRFEGVDIKNIFYELLKIVNI